jgi:hypothetical protein
MVGEMHSSGLHVELVILIVPWEAILVPNISGNAMDRPGMSAHRGRLLPHMDCGAIVYSMKLERLLRPPSHSL